jgi:hypothetical protein
MQEFIVDLSAVTSLEEFAEAFNAGFLHHFGGAWQARSWDAFVDYLSWPEGPYRLVLQGWRRCKGLSAYDRRMIREILCSNPHVEAVFDSP